MTRLRNLLIALPIFILLHLTAQVSAFEITGVASVVDGDTVEIHGERIRLDGIDAPESGQRCLDIEGDLWRCGQAAALALQERIGRAPVTCIRQSTDHYGRTIATCLQRDVDLNGWMVAEGWAVAYRQYSDAYVAHEDQARDTSRNIWGSEFVMPWDWRRGQRVVDRVDPIAVQAKEDGCLIKGNISRSGERIYHVPGGRFYEQTRIDISAGERWFCSEGQAVEAGWRRSRQ